MRTMPRRGVSPSPLSLLLLLLLSLLTVITVAQANQAVVEIKGYALGEPIKMQCRQPDGSWGPGPKCQETNEEMHFRYGVDQFQWCGWLIESNDTYNHLAALISREEDWRCRIAMAPNLGFFLPFNIPVWGVVERDHIHVDNHLNFIFHADAGKIIGVAAYPVRDNFQYGTAGSIITMHGPVKWFSKSTFNSLSSDAFTHSHTTDSVWPVVFMWSLVTFLFTTILFLAIYRWFLRPSLLKTLLKLKKID